MGNSHNNKYAEVSIESKTGVLNIGEAPLTIFEDNLKVEARLTINVDKDSFQDYHALSQHLNSNIAFTQLHSNGVEFITRMLCQSYERRLDSKSCKVVHVFTGVKSLEV